MNTIGQRLAYVIHALGKAGVADRLGVSDRTLRRLLGDEHPPSADLLATLSALGWSASWLLTGEGDARLRTEVAEAPATVESGDYVYVPRYSIRGALGLGIPIESEQVVINPVECTVVGRVRWFARTLLDGTL